MCLSRPDSLRHGVPSPLSSSCRYHEEMSSSKPHNWSRLNLVWYVCTRSAAYIILLLTPRTSNWIHNSKNDLFTAHEINTAFTRSNTGVVGSNLTRGMDVCVRLFCVCVVVCIGRRLATGWFPVQGVLPTLYRIKKLKIDHGRRKGCRAIERETWN
jgi:hypothetical protein